MRPACGPGSPPVWEAARGKGSIYAVINQQIWPRPWGVHVNKELDVIQRPEGKVDAEIGYSPNTDWMFGNQFNAPYRTIETAELNAWEQTRRLNNSAVPHITLGFTFDRKPVENEIAQVQAVAAEFCEPVYAGWIEFEGNYETCLEKLDAAGRECTPPGAMD